MSKVSLTKASDNPIKVYYLRSGVRYIERRRVSVDVDADADDEKKQQKNTETKN